LRTLFPEKDYQPIRKPSGAIVIPFNRSWYELELAELPHFARPKDALLRRTLKSSDREFLGVLYGAWAKFAASKRHLTRQEIQKISAARRGRMERLSDAIVEHFT
jgi:hypothetical protein